MQPGVFIDNAFAPGNGAKFAARDPATDKTVWSGKAANKMNVHFSVQAARKAYPVWVGFSIAQRAAFIEKFAGILKGRKEEIAAAISRETGKPLWESNAEADVAVNKAALTVEAYRKRCADESEPMGEALRATHYKPHGVVAVLGPFNLPVHLPNGHILPAVLAGNTVVFKPSEQTPLTGQIYMECWKEAGFPSGVLNMVQGGKDTGIALTEHVDMNGLFFTGSHQTGCAIHKAWAGKPEKILALEMGGNNPLIVDEVGDIIAACYMIIQSAFITAGQRCVCARRLIVIENKHSKDLLARLTAMTKSVRVGAYTQRPEPFMGPVIDKRAAKRVLERQKELVRHGGIPLLECANRNGRAMLTPGIIDVTPVGNRSDEEIFGPLLQLVRVRNLEEAIREANRTEYGLAGGILSDSRNAYEQFYCQSRCGVVNWNRPTTGASSRGPFGGVGKSGNFRPSAYFAADYCSYPVATIEAEHCKLPERLAPGITL